MTQADDPVNATWPAVPVGAQSLLEDAVSVLTAAARATYPPLTRNESGEWVTDPAGQPQKSDWAQFVTHALAGAAANIGGVDAILDARPGSWEAEHVRALLTSVAGRGEARLWEHRTEPLQITVYVEEILVDVVDAWSGYEQAGAQIEASEEAARAGQPVIEVERYFWAYDRTNAGEFVARDPAAPAWSLRAWRDAAIADGATDETLAFLEAGLTVTGLGGHPLTLAYLPKSRQAAEELHRLEEQRDVRLAVFADQAERLEAQRVHEWTAYGYALKERIEALAEAMPGLSVPVLVTVDLTTYRPLGRRGHEQAWGSLETRLIDDAVIETPTPADLPGTPMSRLEAATLEAPPWRARGHAP